jgi:uncharacterized protein
MAGKFTTRFLAATVPAGFRSITVGGGWPGVATTAWRDNPIVTDEGDNPAGDVLDRSPLHYAALGNDLAEAEAILAAGEDPDATDADGFTPLHLAAQESALDVARLLLERGADVDRRNTFGNTPLWVAVYNSRGASEMIWLLRSHGADPLAANRSGQTPAALARLIANYDVARFFDDVEDE